MIKLNVAKLKCMLIMLFFPFSSYSASIVFGAFTLPEQHIVMPGSYRAGQVMTLRLNIQNATRIDRTYVDCNGQITAGYGSYYYHIGLPRRVSVGGKWLDVSLGGKWRNDNNDSNFNYYTSNSMGGYGTNKPCELLQKTDSTSAPEVAIAIIIPQVFLDGTYRIVVPVVLGEGSNYWDWPQNAYDYRLDALKSGGIASAVKTHISRIIIDVHITAGGCTSDNSTYEINHGSLSIDSAKGHYAKTQINITCASPVTATFTLVSNSAPAYNLAYPTVGLGNGWDSIMNIGSSGSAQGNYSNTATWYNATRKFNLEVGSVLYGEEGKVKPGNLSGSMTLLMSIN